MRNRKVRSQGGGGIVRENKHPGVACALVIGRLRQEDCGAFEGSMGYMGCSVRHGLKTDKQKETYTN